MNGFHVLKNDKNTPIELHKISHVPMIEKHYIDLCCSYSNRPAALHHNNANRHYDADLQGYLVDSPVAYWRQRIHHRPSADGSTSHDMHLGRQRSSRELFFTSIGTYLYFLALVCLCRIFIADRPDDISDYDSVMLFIFGFPMLLGRFMPPPPLPGNFTSPPRIPCGTSIRRPSRRRRP